MNESVVRSLLYSEPAFKTYSMFYTQSTIRVRSPQSLFYTEHSPLPAPPGVRLSFGVQTID